MSLRPALRLALGALLVALATTGGLRVLTLGITDGRAEDVVLDLEKIFTCDDQTTMAPEPCNQARTLLQNNCTVCHPFFQIVLRQYDSGGWTSVVNRHRERVRHLSDTEFALIHDYLAAKFNPEREPPELPEDIIKSLTDY